MTPARGKCLVRRVETPETLPGGLVVLTEATREGLTGQQAEIVAVGAPSLCDDADCERPHVWGAFEIRPAQQMLKHRTHLGMASEHGSWVLLAPRSLVETDEPGLYVVSQDDVLAILQP